MNDQIQRLIDYCGMHQAHVDRLSKQLEEAKQLLSRTQDELSVAWLEHHGLSTETRYRITERYNAWYRENTRHTSSFRIGELVHIRSADSELLSMQETSGAGYLSLPITELHLLDEVKS